jgi:hypothetical protein
VFDGFSEAHCLEEIELLLCRFAGAVECAIADVGSMLLDAREEVQGAARAGALFLSLQAHAHDAVEYEGQKADQRVSANAIWQPVVNRRNFDVGLENAEPPLDIGELLITPNGFGWSQVGSIGDERELSIVKLCAVKNLCPYFSLTNSSKA